MDKWKVNQIPLHLPVLAWTHLVTWDGNFSRRLNKFDISISEFEEENKDGESELDDIEMVCQFW